MESYFRTFQMRDGGRQDKRALLGMRLTLARCRNFFDGGLCFSPSIMEEVRVTKFLGIAAVWGLLLGGVARTWAEEAPRRSMTAVRVNPISPKIDGVLNDEVWQYAPRFGGFTQRIPNEGQPATDSTSVQFTYDDKSLYVAIMCYDKEPDKIAAGLTRRDQFPYSADWVHLSIDSNFDRQTAYSFFLTTAGALVDGYYYSV